MLDLLFSLPRWLVSGIIGAILGGLGAGLAALIFKGQPNIARWLPLVLVVGGIGLTQSFLYPLLEDSDWAMCVSAEHAAKATNEQQAGTKLDEITTIASMLVDCERRTVTYNLSVAAGRDALTPEGIESVRADFSSGQCGNADWRRFIDRGWTVANAYSFTSGEPLVMTASC